MTHAADTRRRINVGLAVVQRRRRWTNVKPTLIHRLVSAGDAAHWHRATETEPHTSVIGHRRLTPYFSHRSPTSEVQTPLILLGSFKKIFLSYALRSQIVPRGGPVATWELALNFHPTTICCFFLLRTKNLFSSE